jgi:outer membrane protein TolC
MHDPAGASDEKTAKGDAGSGSLMDIHMQSLKDKTIYISCGILLSILPAAAQTSSPSSGARVQQVPLSGRQGADTVSTQQSANSAVGSSADTIKTSIQVQGRYQGSIPDPRPVGSALILTLEDALHRGLQYNLGAVSASTSLRQVRAERLASLSQLLPNINASLSMTEQKADLESLGLSNSTLASAGTNPPFAFPTTVGPFHYYDARGTVSEDAFDLTALHNYRSAKELERASQLSVQDAQELIVMAVSGEYLNVLASAALVDSQTAQVQYAQSSYDQAAAQHTAGTKALIDAQRSLVQLQTEQQRLTSDKADLAKQKLALPRILGLPLRTELTLQEKLSPNPVSLPPMEETILRGVTQRADLKSSESSLRAAEQALKAARAEHIPNASVNGYYGVQGVTPTSGGRGVFSATGSINIPIWQGGRIESDVQQAEAVVDQRRAEYQDQRGVVELDIRNAYIDVNVANEQVTVAENNSKLALDTLRQSQDRFTAGVTDSVEVVQSEETLAAAERDYINSLYSQNLAKISLWRAIGEAEQHISGLLKGN